MRECPNQPAAAWMVEATGYDPQDEGRREALFALGNGVFVVRAAAVHACAGTPRYAGTYRAGGYERVVGCIEGEPDESDTLVNLPDGLPLDLRIGGDAWFRLDQADLRDYRHTLELRSGTAVREFSFRDTRGRCTRLREQRLVSMAQPHLLALRLELTALDWSGPVAFRSALAGGIANENVPRYADYPRRYLEVTACRALPHLQAVLEARAGASGWRVAAALRTACDAAACIVTPFQEHATVGHLLQVHVPAGATVAIEKVVALSTSLDAGVADPLAAAQALLARAPGYAALRSAHVRAWRRLWARAALRAQDTRMARDLRLHAFHLLQTLSPHTAALDVGVPARGWHGEAYRGHVFWDEAFVLPVLDARWPEVARSCLLYRHRRLDEARDLAREAGFAGAMYPWRSAATGREVTPRFQKNMLTGTWARDHTYLQRHVGCAIALDVWRHYLATGDLQFLCERGAEMVLEIARFWGRAARLEADGERFGIRGVLGPDEYHTAYPGSMRPGLDNNAYTNLMAAWTLSCALDLLDELPCEARRVLEQRLALAPAELTHWDRVSRRLVVPFHGEGLISQYPGFERLRPFDPAVLPPHLSHERADWALRAIGEHINDWQLTKQADALTPFHLLTQRTACAVLQRLGYSFDGADLLHTARYYLARTTHQSSLSRVVYAGALAQADPELSWKQFCGSLGTDLHVLAGESVAEGIHLAAMGGTLDILQRHYLGLRPERAGLRLAPSLPRALGSVRLSLRYRGQRLEAESDGRQVRLRSARGNREAIVVLLGDARRELGPGGEVASGLP